MKTSRQMYEDDLARQRLFFGSLPKAITDWWTSDPLVAHFVKVCQAAGDATFTAKRALELIGLMAKRNEDQMNEMIKYMSLHPLPFMIPVKP